jgi:CBS domain containing-hemolysin-like protein
VIALLAFVGGSQFDSAAAALWFGLAGGLGVGLIEMTVGLLASRGAETSALRLARAVQVNHIVFTLPARLLALPVRLIARSLEAVTPDERLDIVSLVEREEASGGVEERERRMIRGVIALEDKTAREIMVPRLDMVVADVDDGLDAVAGLIYQRGFSRIPVFKENVDDIVGIVTAKDILRAMSSKGSQRLQDLLRPACFIPESKRLDELLSEMRASRNHIAIVIDEYGGTAGLVTIEDLLEEIVGDIKDEYDVAEPTIDVISEDEVVLEASAPVEVLQELFGRDAHSDEYDTVGGFLIHELGRLPVVGDEVVAGDLRVRVLSMAGRRVKRVRLTRVREEVEAS